MYRAPDTPVTSRTAKTVISCSALTSGGDPPHQG